jgi:uncharacterized ParB-like nuclease family protein
MKLYKQLITELVKVSLGNKVQPNGEREIGSNVRDMSNTKSEKTKTIPVHKITTFEGGDKTSKKAGSSESRANVDSIKKHIQRGGSVPPILVRRHQGSYQVVDGHHRLQAHKEAGIKNIDVHVVNSGRIDGDKY